MREEEAEQEAAITAAMTRGRSERRTIPLHESVTVGEYDSLNPAPRIKLEGLDTLPDVRGVGRVDGCQGRAARSKRRPKESTAAWRRPASLMFGTRPQ